MILAGLIITDYVELKPDYIGLKAGAISHGTALDFRIVKTRLHRVESLTNL